MSDMQNVIDCLTERGFIEAVTSSELAQKAAGSLKVYVGFDPTADSLHLGNLVGIIGLAWMQRFGHTPYVILGGATGLIGDPSGKSTERPLLDEEKLNHNIASLKRFFEQILPSKIGPQPVILNNNDWLSRFSFIEFLRDVGKHFRLGPMLAKEMVRSRLQSEEGISFTEFSYQILQGYDFHYLESRHGVSVQMGGTDQWGNITAGIELNRKLGGNPLYGMTFPLLTRSDGKKFGKSEGGAVWLSPEKLSPFQFFQYLYSIPDADVIRLLKMLTFLPLEEIEALAQSMQHSTYCPNTAQKLLATEVTRFVHGEAGLQTALRVTQDMAPGAIATLNSERLAELSNDISSVELSHSEVVGQKFVDLTVNSGFVPSKAETVRLIKNGGLSLNNIRIENSSFFIQSTHLIDGKFLLLSIGKKKRLLIKII